MELFMRWLIYLWSCYEVVDLLWELFMRWLIYCGVVYEMVDLL